MSAETGGMPQLDTEFWISQIFWLLITFGLLFVTLSKFILPNISANLESRKSQILDNLEIADKQREESENKIKKFDKIIIESKNEAKNIINDAKRKLIEDINKKKEALETEINTEIMNAEKEISDLVKKSPEKINQIAIETSSGLIKQLINADVNKSNISAIVEDLSKRSKEKYHGV
tara:strand:- start:904 stop:1434 length:531 start_codon:yes stop_codon:yes gene_type:complete